MTRSGFLCFLLLCGTTAAGEAVHTTEALVAAVRDGADGTVIEIAAGTYELNAPLEPKPGMTLKGAGMDQTIITHVADWKPSTSTLPDPEMKTDGMDTRAYLIRLQDKATDVTISGMTLRGPQLHGAIFGWANKDLHLHHLRIQDTLWSGIRTFAMQRAKIHDCEFIDAGGRWKRGGKPGVDGGITGGAIFAIWMKDSEIAHNRFERTQMGKADEFYGIKVRQGKRSRVHHNTIEVNFSLEFPFENDEDNEIDHNVCHGTVSIPKHSGGPVPDSGRTFHIHHNWFRNSYSIEFVRNGVEIDQNLFDFDVDKDHGNLISGFGKAAAKGPASFHNNLVSNPGRGVIWINEPYSNLEIHNNHIITRTTKTPRTEGLFGFNSKCDFKTIAIRDNLIECLGQSRPLLRTDKSYDAVVENNRLINVSDTDRYANEQRNRPMGLEEPLKFACGVHGEFVVDGWNTRRADDTPLFSEDGIPAGWLVRQWADVSRKADDGVVWTVKDGVLYGSPTRGTWLMSEQEYGDFSLEYEFKLGPRGNSGLAIRSPLTGDPAFDGMELQMADYRYNTQAKDSELTGGISRAIAPRKQVYWPTEWNKYVVTLIGDHLHVELNGEVIHDVDLSTQDEIVKRHDDSTAPAIKDRPRRGHIGFQELSRDAERVQIRNARIRSFE